MFLRTAFTGVMFCGVTLLLSGCSSVPTHADIMRSSAADTQAEAETKKGLAENWDRGQALIISGNQKVSTGEDLLKAGKRELNDGRRLVRDSEREFKNKYPDTPFSK